MAGKGNPKGSCTNFKHGIVQVKRRVQRRNYLDLRTQEGREALRIQAGLVDDQGGIDAITAARFIAIKELTQHYYLASLIDHSILTYLYKNPQSRNSARMLARLVSYRVPVSNGIARYLDILGLDKKPPKITSLDEIKAEILAKDDGQDQEPEPEPESQEPEQS